MVWIHLSNDYISLTSKYLAGKKNNNNNTHKTHIMVSYLIHQKRNLISI